MIHRKVHSQGSIPFSWEDKPGVSKNPNLDYCLHIGSVDGMNKKSTSSPFPAQAAAPAIEDKKIPLPPCPLQPPRRSTSGKGFRWQQDPFLVAYKECTKGDKNKALGSANSKVRKSKSIFSCKSSTDAKDDHFVNLSRLPRLPSDKYKLDFNYEPRI